MQHHERQPRRLADNNVVQDLIPDMTSMHVNYPLVVIAGSDPHTGRLAMRVEYDPDCLERVQAIRFVEQLGHLAKQCLRTELPVSEMTLLTEADLTDIWAWNSVRPSAEPHQLHHLFQEMVSRQPQRLAIDSNLPATCLCRRLSYLELDDYATNLSERLKELGALHVRIGLCFEKSPLMIIATLDPSAPVQRLQAILQDIGAATVLLTQPDLAHQFASSKTLVLDPSLLTLLPELCRKPGHGERPKADQDVACSDIAYIMYTSGSSGVPKGVVVSHSAIATSLRAVAAIMGLHAKTCMTQSAAFTFDTSLLEIFATLITGDCVCMPSDSQRLHGGLADATRELRISQLVLTPTMARLIEFKDIPTVQGLMLVREPPTPEIIEHWKTAKPDAQLLNGYGPTEASVHASTNTSLRHNDPFNIGHATGCNLFLTVPDQVDKLAAI